MGLPCGRQNDLICTKNALARGRLRLRPNGGYACCSFSARARWVTGCGMARIPLRERAVAGLA